MLASWTCSFASEVGGLTACHGEPSRRAGDEYDCPNRPRPCRSGNPTLTPHSGLQREDVDLRRLRMGRKDPLGNPRRIDRHCVPEQRGQPR